MTVSALRLYENTKAKGVLLLAKYEGTDFCLEIPNYPMQSATLSRTKWAAYLEEFCPVIQVTRVWGTRSVDYYQGKKVTVNGKS